VSLTPFRLVVLVLVHVPSPLTQFVGTGRAGDDEEGQACPGERPWCAFASTAMAATRRCVTPITGRLCKNWRGGSEEQ
jgi:hypothetical protein